MNQGSFGAYAAHRVERYGESCSRQAVAKAVKAARLRISVERDAAGVPRIADFALADREWSARTDYRRRPDRLRDELPDQPSDQPPIGPLSVKADAENKLVELHYADPFADEEADDSCCVGLAIEEANHLAHALLDAVRRLRRRRTRT